ncbi:MAG: hypothetical protein ACQER7_11035 [Bacteroidota bacterium]
MNTSRELLILLCITGVLISCNSKAENPENDKATVDISANLQLVTITTADFVFVDVPDSISSGLTTFRIENDGMFPHNAGLVHISDGHTYEELIQYMEKNMGKYPDWATLWGGPSAPISGEKSEATLDLIPGNYAIICGVPVPAAEPHFMKGMTRPLTVTDPDNDNSEAPKADMVMNMDDYSFGISDTVAAGNKTIKVENSASQPHEFILARLEEGKTLEDMMNWLGQVINGEAGPLPKAPGIFLNGVSPMDKGVANYITVDFAPGEYALICPYPDEQSGDPHFVHGMMQQVSVK